MTRKNRRLPRITKARLEEMIEQATVDAYNESKQITGWFTMIDENLAVPFETTGVEDGKSAVRPLAGGHGESNRGATIFRRRSTQRTAPQLKIVLSLSQNLAGAVHSQGRENVFMSPMPSSCPPNPLPIVHVSSRIAGVLPRGINLRGLR
jgi:Calcium binding